MTTPRRRAREVALQVLYAAEADPDAGAAVALHDFFVHFADSDEEEEGLAAGEGLDRPFAEDLVTGVDARRAELDEALSQLSRTWRLERMARVDRNVLRLALFELKHRDDIPTRVALNEAIELAKRFGAPEAAPFVNGVLDSALEALGIDK